MIRFREFDIPTPYRAVWENQHVFDLVARNPPPAGETIIRSRAISGIERHLRFNVRIATPPPGRIARPGSAHPTSSTSSRATS